MSDWVNKKRGEPLPIVHAKEALKKSLEYIEGRRNGTITSYRTKFDILNKCLLDGFEDNTICTISALSGGGKSALSQLLRESIYDLNPDKPAIQIPMNFEMVAKSLAARSAVTNCNIDLKKLYSVEEPLSDADFEFIKQHYEKISSREVYFIDRAGTASQIVDSLYHYWKKFCKDTGKAFLYEIDHVKLIRKGPGQSDVQALDDLCVELVDFKKTIESEGGSSLGFMLSQLNRKIKEDSRVLNPEMHKPDASCLFGASSMEFASDYIVFVHTPAALGIQKYTTQNLPTWYKAGEYAYKLPYFELVKNRSGDPGITIPLINKLHRFDFDEMPIDVFKDLCGQFQQSDYEQIPQLRTQLKI